MGPWRSCWNGNKICEEKTYPSYQLEAKLLCEYHPFYNQMIIGVLTEQGVQKSSEVLLNKDTKSVFGVFKNSLNQEMKTLNQLRENLIENVFKIAACTDPIVKLLVVIK